MQTGDHPSSMFWKFYWHMRFQNLEPRWTGWPWRAFQSNGVPDFEISCVSKISKTYLRGGHRSAFFTSVKYRLLHKRRHFSYLIKEDILNSMSEWSRSVVSDSLRPCDVAYQAPPSVGFSRQEYWGGLPFPSPGDLPNPGIEPRFPEL